MESDLERMGMNINRKQREDYLKQQQVRKQQIHSTQFNHQRNNLLDVTVNSGKQNQGIAVLHSNTYSNPRPTDQQVPSTAATSSADHKHMANF